jgi:hypothetical protein
MVSLWCKVFWALSSVALLCGCGGRTELLTPPGPASPSASAEYCEVVAWAACSSMGRATVVATGADEPSLAFTGSVLILGHQTDTGVGLTVLTPDGAPIRSLALRGYNQAKVAYHAGLDRAVALAEGSITWLDGLGSLVGTSVEASIYSGEPALMLTVDGFLGLLPSPFKVSSLTPHLRAVWQ